MWQMSDAVSDAVRLDNDKPRRPPLPNVCKFFRRTGSCIYGDRCIYSHNIPVMKGSYINAARSQDVKDDSSPKHQVNLHQEKSNRENFSSRSFSNFHSYPQNYDKSYPVSYPVRFRNQGRSSRENNSFGYTFSRTFDGRSKSEFHYDSSVFFKNRQAENWNQKLQNGFFNGKSRSSYNRRDGYRTFQSRCHNKSWRNNANFYRDVYIEDLSHAKAISPRQSFQAEVEDRLGIVNDKIWTANSFLSETKNVEEDRSSLSERNDFIFEFKDTHYSKNQSSDILKLQDSLKNLEIGDFSFESLRDAYTSTAKPIGQEIESESVNFSSDHNASNALNLMSLENIESPQKCDTVLNVDFQSENYPSTRTDHNLIECLAPEKERPEMMSNAESTLMVNRIPITRRDLLMSDLTEEDYCKLRKTEIEQLKKRFPQRILDSSTDNEDSFAIEVSSTDPDWSLDFKTIILRVVFPDDYPKSCFQIWIADSDNKHLPEGITEYVTPVLQSWITSEHENCSSEGKVKLHFRPFLHWLDKNLEMIFRFSLKQIMKMNDSNGNILKISDYLSDEVIKSDDVEEDNQPHCSFEDQPSHCDSSSSYRTKQYGSLMNAKKGTEIKFRSVQLGDNAATLLCQKLKPVLQCQRCKTQCNVSTTANRPNCFHCNKCKFALQATFRPNLLHPHASILGYLDLKNCSVCDIILVDCDFFLSCLNCNKQMTINGLHLDQQHNTWCHSCHSKMSVSLSAPKFKYFGPTERSLGASQTEKKAKKVKEACIQEGKCLPDNGTCKHYKKSFRWLRFPCCGKAFPCDKCHNEKESHEMKVANRMICGFCGKEQPFVANKPCIGCKSGVTKSSSAHWEGGKGCRDKNKMSRDDAHKFKGAAKTTSKKSQVSSQKKTPKSKK